MIVCEKDFNDFICIRELNFYGLALYHTYTKANHLVFFLALKSIDYRYTCKPPTIIIVM